MLARSLRLSPWRALEAPTSPRQQQSTDELKLERAFYKASGKSTFPPRSIGIGNVGKKGGNVTPGGVQVSLVALCNYILRHGGWEKVREPISSALSASVPSHT